MAECRVIGPRSGEDRRATHCPPVGYLTGRFRVVLRRLLDYEDVPEARGLFSEHGHIMSA